LIGALAGGIGAARFLEGLIRVIPQREITIIGNVGDDTDVYGLHVSPDLDIVTYTLAGVVDAKKGWGFRGDTFHCQTLLRKYGFETWFNLGDRDLATHIYRTEALRRGKRLSEVTADLISRSGLRVKLFPASDDPLQTYVLSGGRQMHFQEYMVKRKTRPTVQGVFFRGAESARPAKHVRESIARAKGIIVCPSNPIVSIGAILAVPGIKSALKKTRAKVVGISPIVGGKTVKGPADKLMKAVGVEASALGVAECYSDFLDTLIIDSVDRALAPDIEALGIRTIVMNTLMRTLTDKVRLARVAKSEFNR
jgi:LPPG:FO 2-phospho-L-lactate transferase